MHNVVMNYHDADVRKYESDSDPRPVQFYAICACGWRGRLRDRRVAADDDKLAHDRVSNPQKPENF